MIFYDDFKYGDKLLSEMKGVIKTQDNNGQLNTLVPKYKIISSDVPNVAISKFIKKIREPYEFNLSLFFEDVTNEELLDIKAWLDKDKPAEFYFIPDIHGVGRIKMITSSYVQSELYYGSKPDTYCAVITLTFSEFI